MRRDASIDRDVPRGRDAHLGTLEAMVSCGPRRFGKGRQANANEGLVWPLLTGFGTPVGIVEQFQDTFQPLRIVARVIRQASRRLVGKGVRRNEVASAYLGGI